MNAAVVDTDVVSMLFKGDSRALQYHSYLAGYLLGISFMTFAELERWPLERNWGAFKRAQLAQHLTGYTVLPVSRDLCTKWAASALYYQVPLITHNAADYKMISGLQVLTV